MHYQLLSLLGKFVQQHFVAFLFGWQPVQSLIHSVRNCDKTYQEYQNEIYFCHCYNLL